MATQPEYVNSPTRNQIENSIESILDELWGLADETILDAYLQTPSPLLLPEPMPTTQEDDPISLLQKAKALSESGLISEARGFRIRAMLLMQVMT